MHLIRTAVLRTLAVAATCLGLAATAEAQITVFAAASLKNALDEIAPAYETETGENLAVSLAGSSALARQIGLGAPADVFISANTDWMDRLAEDGAIRPETRVELLSNRLVLVAHRPAEAVVIGPALDLAGLLDGGHLAMALVDAVPAGIYGKAALTSLGLWDSVAPMVAQTDNVRAALALVASGEAPLGIVYASDAVADPGVTVLGTFPADSHPEILYPAALTTRAAPEAAGFLDFLQGPVARAAFERQGFTVLTE